MGTILISLEDRLVDLGMRGSEFYSVVKETLYYHVV